MNIIVKIFIIFVIALGSLLGGSSLCYSFNTAINLKTATMKRCTQCNELKIITEFSVDKSVKSLIKSECNTCAAIRAAKYRKTINGLISKIYSNQKLSSIRRGHNKPEYTSKELNKFAKSSIQFLCLYSDWVYSGFDKMKVPSFDRKDDYKCYSFDNFNRWMTWKDNKRKGHSDCKNGINNKRSKSVIATNLKTGKVIKFFSITEASRQTLVSRGNIFSVCNGKRTHAGGFKWCFTLEQYQTELKKFGI